MTTLLTDFSAIFHRQWHATADQDLSYASQRTAEYIRSIAAGYDDVVVCLDGGHQHRTAIDPQYKANRENKEQAFVEQMRRCAEDVGRDYRLAKAPGYEADDVIATLVKGTKGEVVIATADKDLAQLINERVSILRTSSADREIVGPEWVKDKFGVSPEQVRDWLALVGDKADNIQGVHGCGTKTAAKLLAKYGGLGLLQEAVASRPDEFTEKQLENLREAFDSGSLGRAHQLVRLVDDVEIEFSRTEVEASESDGGFVSEEIEEVEGELVADGVEETPEAPKSDVKAVEPKAIVRVQRDFSEELQPTTLEDAYRIARAAANSRLFASYGGADAAFAVIMAGRELGIKAMTALRTFHVVEGKPTMSAQLMMGLCQRSSQCEYFQPVSVTNEVARYVTKRVGNQEPTTWEYSMEDAQRAGLAGKNNWKKHPKLMLMNRCISELARAVYPDIVANLYTADEISQGAVDNEVAA